MPCLQRWRQRHEGFIQFVENRIQTTAADDNEETVIKDIINNAKSKFQALSPQFDTFVRKVTEVVIHRHRQVVDLDGAEKQLDVICEEYKEDIQTIPLFKAWGD